MVKKNEMHNRDDISEIASKNITVFTKSEHTLGLPSQVFFFGIIIALGIGVVFYLWCIPLILLLYYPVMFRIHKDDSKALPIWKRAILRKHHYWSTGFSRPCSLTIFR